MIFTPFNPILLSKNVFHNTYEFGKRWASNWWHSKRIISLRSLLRFVLWKRKKGTHSCCIDNFPNSNQSTLSTHHIYRWTQCFQSPFYLSLFVIFASILRLARFFMLTLMRYSLFVSNKTSSKAPLKKPLSARTNTLHTRLGRREKHSFINSGAPLPVIAPPVRNQLWRQSLVSAIKLGLWVITLLSFIFGIKSLISSLLWTMYSDHSWIEIQRDTPKPFFLTKHFP